MKGSILGLLVILLFPLSFLLSQQKNVEGKPPHVKILQDSTMVITFTKEQINAIKKFLELHPNLLLYTSDVLDPYDKIDNYNYYKEGEMQFQFACWGDINNDKFLDVVVIFRTKKSTNKSWYPTFYIVLLKGNRNETYDPLVVDTIDSSRLDGVLYNKTENIVKYFISGVAGGSFQWSNGKLKVNKMMGD